MAVDDEAVGGDGSTTRAIRHTTDFEARTWQWPAEVATVPKARTVVSAYLDAAATPDPPLADIRLALSEAVSNVILHAYIDAPEPGEVRVRVEWTAEEVFVVVEDDGCGMRPRQRSPGGGMGLPLMASLADSLEALTTPLGGTSLVMRFGRSSGPTLH